LKNKDLREGNFDTPEPGHYDTAPMSRPADRPLDALDLARGEARVERDFEVAAFSRVRDRLAESQGTISARADFRLDGHWPVARLEVAGDVVLVCQRCLGPVRRKLESAADLVFAEGDAYGAPAGYEPVDGDPRRVDLASLVEDEVLLALPIIPQHGAGERCDAPASRDAQRGASAGDLRRPFAGLKDLLKH